jgi:phosphinothricin acetyltransferase
MTTAITLRAMTPDDWPDVARIYAEGMATGQATFTTEVPDWTEWDVAHVPEPRLVALDGGRMIGWAALSPVSRRRVYGGVAEVSVYIGDGARGRGTGRALLSALVAQSEAAGFWMLQSSVFPENAPSLALQARFGFRVVGRRERIAQHHGVWRDTLLLERRSPVVGAASVVETVADASLTHPQSMHTG